MADLVDHRARLTRTGVTRSMETFEKSTEIPVSAETLYEWHMRPGALQDLIPPWQRVQILDPPDSMTEGAELTMKVYAGPVGLRWVARHRDFIEGRQFVDEQVEGPFATWVHTHRFAPLDPDRSRLIDRVRYELPVAPLGRWFGGWFARRTLEQMFEFRHRTTLEALRGGAPDETA